MHEILDSGKCVFCCTACVAMAVVGCVAAMAVILNLIKMAMF
jgi:hypothetical protein